MTVWLCEVCGNEYDLPPKLLEKEKSYHGEDRCGMSTTQQRVTYNTTNVVRRAAVRGETFAATLDRLVREWEGFTGRRTL